MKKQFKTYSSIAEKKLSEDLPKGERIAYISGWASKNYEDGQAVVDRDGEIVETKGFDVSQAKVLLAQHDWDRPVGTIKLSHKDEGIYIEAEVHEAMDEKVYYAVKNGILDSFSIGFTVEDYEYTTKDGKDILVFTKGQVYETSLISIPSNAKATIDQVKSVCNGIECSLDALKEMNPNCECIKDIEKGLTLARTVEEDRDWKAIREIDYYMDLLRDTLWDNVYSRMDGDIIGADVHENFLNSIDQFKNLVELELNKIQQTKGMEDMAEKQLKEATEEVVEKEEPTQEVEQEENIEETETRETEEAEKEETKKDEPKQEDAEETVSETQVAISENTKPTQTDSVQQTISTIATVNLNDLSFNDINSLYEQATLLVEKVEDYVENEGADRPEIQAWLEQLIDKQ